MPKPKEENASDLVIVAQLGGPHGVQGDVKLRSFCDPPEACFEYGPLLIEDGKTEFKVVNFKPYKQGFVVRTFPIHAREYWSELGRIDLYVRRQNLPPTDPGEFYHANLIGLDAVDQQRTLLGRVSEVLNFGAGDILYIISESANLIYLVPFDEDAVPDVNLTQGTVTIKDPDLWLQE